MNSITLKLLAITSFILWLPYLSIAQDFENKNIQVGFTQENLRPRVASVTYQDKAGTAYDRATHYSYDVHGNVKNLIQEIDAAGVAMKKRMDYDYDLVSGKVNIFYYLMTIAV